MIYVWSSAPAPLVMETVGLEIRGAGVEYALVPHTTVPQGLGQGDVVLVLGKALVGELAKRGMVMGSAGPGALRGKRIHGPGTGADFMVSWDPRLTQTEARHIAEMAWDAKLAVRLHETGTTRPAVGEGYSWAKNLSELIGRVKAKAAETGRAVPVAMDTESQGLYPYYEGKNIVTTQWSDAAGRAWVVDHRPHWGNAVPGLTKPLAQQIHWLLNSPQVRIWGANLKFDLQWLAIKWADWEARL